MKLFRTLTLCGLSALSFFGASCASTPYPDIVVESEASTEANFDGYSSYAWVAAAAAIRDPDGTWAIPDLDIGAEIMFLTNQELRGRGLSEVAADPDLLVMYGVGIDMKSIDAVVDEEAGTTSLKEVPKGGVVIIVSDAKTRRVVWTGSAEANLLEQPSEELGKKRMGYAISAMFKKSPL
ncbi:MAG: hypothetical protein ACI8X5_003955 [Planctomycetota bacterium]|jgi:hypothetical protein